ncbi:hypothetical protein K432DRAFT_410619 [Lepidopterella palustris CBS 459.81]|uniref:Uncharacterized protein n=1 Tax=Lepidopterella palustris CBS 459.81 TaxID=1314670 RepID=A0A8E2DXT2_9PEZI|nr:hypothetical protein K432DRAFT_410619 [Lepidopterella palustris CBS 459.81]
MPSTFVIQDPVVPLGNLRLGRLVLDIHNAHQDFIDPECNEEPQYTVSTHDHFKRIIDSSEGSMIANSLSTLVSFARNRETTNTKSLIAPKASTYSMLNSGSWFRQVCKLPQARTWMQEAIANGEDIYLIVGYKTVLDAEIVEKTVAKTDGKVQGTGKTGFDVLGISSDGTTATLGQNQNSIDEHTSSATGEQVYAVQFRKVQFKWFSGGSIENSFLEKGNRWKVYSATRGPATGDVEILEAELDEKTDFDAISKRYMCPDLQEEYVL